MSGEGGEGKLPSVDHNPRTEGGRDKKIIIDIRNNHVLPSSEYKICNSSSFVIILDTLSTKLLEILKKHLTNIHLAIPDMRNIDHFLQV